MRGTFEMYKRSFSQTVLFKCYSILKTQINQKAWDEKHTMLLNGFLMCFCMLNVLQGNHV